MYKLKLVLMAAICTLFTNLTKAVSPTKPIQKAKMQYKKTLTSDEEKILNKYLNPFAETDPTGEKIVIALIKKINLDPNYKFPAARDSSTSNLIHLAVFHGYLNLLRELIKMGANINLPNKTRWTPLHIAANLDSKIRPNKLEIIKLLVESGANLENQIADLPRVIDLVRPNSKLNFKIFDYLLKKMATKPAVEAANKK